jgi:hypothetical protein
VQFSAAATNSSPAPKARGPVTKSPGGANLTAIQSVTDFPIVKPDGSSFRLADLRGKVVV